MVIALDDDPKARGQWMKPKTTPHDLYRDLTPPIQNMSIR